MDTFQDVHLDFSEDSLWVLNLAMAFIMFGVALKMDVREFKEVVRNPKGIVTGFLSQFMLLPAVTFLLILIVKPLPPLAYGMMLVAACPGGNVSNFFTQLSSGNVTLSVSLTGIATMASIFMTPTNFRFWTGLYARKQHFAEIDLEFWAMFKTVLLLLVIPLFLGMALKRFLPELTEKIGKPIRILSMLTLATFILVAFSKNSEIFMEYYHHVVWIVLMHNAIALLSGYLWSAAMRLPQRDRRTISMETGIQNSGLALVIIFSLFDGSGGMAIIAAWWGIWHIIAGFVLSWFYRKWVPLPA
jgi:BASS family bile acid:Na+ symporter